MKKNSNKLLAIGFAKPKPKVRKEISQHYAADERDYLANRKPLQHKLTNKK